MHFTWHPQIRRARIDGRSNALQFRVLITGCGGIGGVNFVRAINFGAERSKSKLFLVGTEFDDYYIRFPKLNAAIKSPRHSDPSFLPLLKDLIAKHRLEFLHPNPSSEARVVAEHLAELGAKTFLPKCESISPDKETIWKKMKANNVAVPETFPIDSFEAIQGAFRKIGSPLWLRAKQGAGARLALKVNSPEEAMTWIKLNLSQGRSNSIREYLLQEFMAGRDIAFDSLWYEGELIASSARERLEYPLKHISLTGLTGTPSVARIIYDTKITGLGLASVKALDSRPHGFFSTDIKEDEKGAPVVTEVDGKWHTTAPLWGYAVAKAKRDNTFNIAFTYLLLGSGRKSVSEFGVSKDLYPEGLTLIRQMDSGVILHDEKNDKTWRIL